MVALHTPDPDVPAIAGELALSHLADPESCLIGALLYQDAARAAAVLDLLDTDDMDDPRARLVLGLLRAVVADGHDPDPPLVLSTAERNGLHGGPDALRALGSYLIGVYGAVPHPGNVDAYALAVVEAAFRRHADRFGMQVQQYAQDGPDADLFHVLRTGPEDLRAHYARMTRAGGAREPGGRE